MYLLYSYCIANTFAAIEVGYGCNDEIETEACGSKCSFNIIKSSQTGRGHIPAEQYPNGQGKREIQVTGKKVKAGLANLKQGKRLVLYADRSNNTEPRKLGQNGLNSVYVIGNR